MSIDLPIVLLRYVCLLFSLCLHEASHAAMANRCGDPSERLLGRLTLNPLKHADPIGTVVMPLVMMVFNFPLLFGWAKPVPFNPRNLHDMRRDPVFISLAGPLSNLALAIISALLLRVLASAALAAPDMAVLPIFFLILIEMIKINLILLLFNLIPLPPLDGHHVLYFFLPPAGKEVLERMGPMGIIFALIAVNQLGILGPPMRMMTRLIEFIAFYGTPFWG